MEVHHVQKLVVGDKRVEYFVGEVVHLGRHVGVVLLHWGEEFDPLGVGFVQVGVCHLSLMQESVMIAKGV